MWNTACVKNETWQRLTRFLPNSVHTMPQKWLPESNRSAAVVLRPKEVTRVSRTIFHFTIFINSMTWSREQTRTPNPSWRFTISKNSICLISEGLGLESAVFKDFGVLTSIAKNIPPLMPRISEVPLNTCLDAVRNTFFLVS